MKTVTVKELKQLMDDNADIQVIDVRELHEVEMGNIGALHIPMGDIMERIDEVEKQKQVVVHCRAGGRSGRIVEFLEQQGYTNLYNLTGGLLAWKEEIDSTLAVE